MADTLLQLFNKAQTWEFIPISLLSLGSFLTLTYSFSSKEALQKTSLYLFVSGSLLWIATILFQCYPLAVTEINKIGHFRFVTSAIGLCFALYSAWMWIKKNKNIWFVLMVVCIFIVVVFVV